MHLVPGIPEIRILGLPDTATRESATRVKSALRASGFEFPAARSVLVQLRPHSERKTSRGLDLAIAAGILWEMGQLPPPIGDALLYGELSLSGGVMTPDDFSVWMEEAHWPQILTGIDVGVRCPQHKGLLALTDLAAPRNLSEHTPLGWQRPVDNDIHVGASAARILEIVAAGSHSCLLAGPAGSGKTSSIDKIVYAAPVLDEKSGRRLRSFHQAWAGEVSEHRPLISPHHSLSAVALVGGGNPPKPGEVTRAHGGFLLLDEFLEFSGRAVEALREPLQTKKVRIARGISSLDFPADFVFLATTNLCPCGGYVPQDDSRCVCATRRRLQYLGRLNGPVLDRLELLVFTNQWLKEETPMVKVSDIAKKVDQAVAKRLECGPLPVDSKLDSMVDWKQMSHRRRQAVYSVAQTIAYLDNAKKVDKKSFCEALELSVWPFNKLLRAVKG